MNSRKDKLWQSPKITEQFLNGLREAIPYAGAQLDMMVRLLAANGRKVESFLDLGCGDGILGAVLLERFPGAKGLLADFSAPMLDAARINLGRQDNVSFAEIDYASPAWTDSAKAYAPFDAIVSGYSIHHQPDGRKRALYRELFGLLSSGGMFVNVEHVTPSSPHAEALFQAHFIDLLHDQDEEQGGSKSREDIAGEFYAREDTEANILAPVDVQCQWLREIGFEQVDCYFQAYELAVFAGCKPR